MNVETDKKTKRRRKKKLIKTPKIVSSTEGDYYPGNEESDIEILELPLCDSQTQENNLPYPIYVDSNNGINICNDSYARFITYPFSSLMNYCINHIYYRLAWN